MTDSSYSDVKIDPITFEVIKHRLWQINDEQALAIKTISSSPIVVEGNDFNVGLFTADGQLTTAGIGSTVHVGTMGTSIRSIMDMVSDIEDGDVILMNDPFLGALHQNDVVIASPVYHEGRILMWVSNVLHHPDVGGIDEGSFCVNARNLYQDPPRFLMKIVSRGKLLKEVEHTFVTNSRLPDMVALDLRAQIGAVHVAKERLLDLVNERGGDVVEAVMRRSIDIAETQIREKLARLPRGSFRGEAWMDGVRVGSDAIVKVTVKLTNHGDRLTFDWTGSDPQVDAAVNSTLHACVAGTSVPLYSFFCQGDIDWNEGLIRCMDVIAPEGTVVNATFPAPVSICTIGFRWLITVAAAQACAKMFDASDEFRDRVCSGWNTSSNCNNVFGIDKNGKRVGALLSDHRGGGSAAKSFDDGISHAGQITSFSSSMANVESQEWKLPMIYLFRKQMADSGGAGKYRGGLTSVAAAVPYGAKELILKATNTAGADQTNAHGLSGGYPGAGSQTIVVKNARAAEQLADGSLREDFETLGGEVDYLPTKASCTLGPDDVLVFYPPGGGGYGDPLERDPARVAEDVRKGWVSQDAARTLYGVATGPDGQADMGETTRVREQMRAARKDGPVTSWPIDRLFEDLEGNGKPHKVGDHAICTWQDGRPQLSCECCGNVLSGPDGKAIIRQFDIGAAGPWAARRFGGQSPNFRLEESICAGCGTRFDVREVRTQAAEAV